MQNSHGVGGGAGGAGNINGNGNVNGGPYPPYQQNVVGLPMGATPATMSAGRPLPSVPSVYNGGGNPAMGRNYRIYYASHQKAPPPPPPKCPPSTAPPPPPKPPRGSGGGQGQAEQQYQLPPDLLQENPYVNGGSDGQLLQPQRVHHVRGHSDHKYNGKRAPANASKRPDSDNNKAFQGTTQLTYHGYRNNYEQLCQSE